MGPGEGRAEKSANQGLPAAGFCHVGKPIVKDLVCLLKDKN
jgi:hypothetical protein